MAGVTLEIDDRELLAKLRELQERGGNLKPALQEIGDYLRESTEDRFAREQAPDGSRWPPNSPVTIQQYLQRRRGSFVKDQRRAKATLMGSRKGLSKKGAELLGSKQILQQDQYLRDTLHHQIDGNTLTFGSDRVYAAMHQFGGRRSEFPNLWGDIPARPFLGLNDQDRREILDIITRRMAGG